MLREIDANPPPAGAMQADPAFTLSFYSYPAGRAFSCVSLHGSPFHFRCSSSGLYLASRASITHAWQLGVCTIPLLPKTIFENPLAAIYKQQADSRRTTNSTPVGDFD